MLASLASATYLAETIRSFREKDIILTGEKINTISKEVKEYNEKSYNRYIQDDSLIRAIESNVIEDLDKEIRKKIDGLIGGLIDTYRDDDVPIEDRDKRAKKYYRELCWYIKQVSDISGGVLPDDLHTEWKSLQCDKYQFS